MIVATAGSNQHVVRCCLEHVVLVKIDERCAVEPEYVMCIDDAVKI